MVSLSAINDFFDLSKPCPSEIKRCRQLRNDYRLELRNMKQCTNCAMRVVKNVYINKINQCSS